MCRAVGKRGEKRTFPWKERTANEWIHNRDAATPVVRSNDARRCLVDATAARFFRIVDLYRLLDLGRISGRALLFRQLHFAVLFPGNFRIIAAQLVWIETKLVAELAHLFTSAANTMGAGRISIDLLLLPRRLL